MLERRVPPPLLTLALALAMWAAAPRAASPELAASWRTALALAVSALAAAFGLPALRAFRRAGTTVDPVRIDRASALVTSGIYRVTRNPMYVSLTLLLVAWALWLGALWAWAGPLALALWLDRFQIRPEEKAMTARFGDGYRRYQAQVRRWV
jgi:protein-S-isoprenylcysteine O-methyltransferase Ste14